MTKKALHGIIKQLQRFRCETQTISVKAAHTCCPTRLYDSISSFSNQDGGGIIVFGIDESKKFDVVGVYDSEDLMQQVLEQCQQMEPAVVPLFTVCTIDKKIVVSAEIPSADVACRPVYYKGAGKIKGSFVRVGEANEPMNAYEIYRYDAYHRRLRDDIRVTNASVSQMDVEKIERYISAVKASKPDLSQLSDNDILELTGIMRDSIPTLAGIICFAKYPQHIFPQLCITAVVVPDTDLGQNDSMGHRFTANERIEGTLEQMLEKAVLFVKKHMDIWTIVDNDGKPKEHYEYPLMAIREAILNALMHRDYSIHTEGSPVRIIMYSNRIEIISSGGLYGTLTIDRLGTKLTDIRNQTLANILEILNVAENRCSGITTIRMVMREACLPPPRFAHKRDTFVITLENNIGNSIAKSRDINAAILKFCMVPRNRDEIVAFIGLSPYYSTRTFITPLVQEGKLRLSIPDKPRSRFQKYMTVV